MNRLPYSSALSPKMPANRLSSLLHFNPALPISSQNLVVSASPGPSAYGGTGPPAGYTLSSSSICPSEARP